MPTITQAGLQALRLKYNVAYTAHRSCVQALTEASMAGQPSSAALLEKAAHALRELTEAGNKLLSAMRGDTQ